MPEDEDEDGASEELDEEYEVSVELLSDESPVGAGSWAEEPPRQDESPSPTVI